MTLIDQEIDGEIEIGKENDDNEGMPLLRFHFSLKLFSDEETESKPSNDTKTENAEGASAEPAKEEEIKQKEWVVNLWLKRQVAEKLPKIKPIPGFCKFFDYLSSWREEKYSTDEPFFHINCSCRF